MENKEIEAAYNETFGGLTMYYRDCELNPDFISKYSVNQIIMERGFTDVSGFAKGLNTNLRYAIASNKARDMTQVNPSVKKYRFHLISAPSHYKVLDIYKIGEQMQILLLHFDAKFIPVFDGINSSIEDKVIGMGRASFDKKIQMPLSAALNESEWRKRTQFPIGMSDTGEFFLASADKTKKEEKPEIVVPKKETSKNEVSTQEPSNHPEEKKSFWKRLFG